MCWHRTGGMDFPAWAWMIQGSRAQNPVRYQLPRGHAGACVLEASVRTHDHGHDILRDRFSRFPFEHCAQVQNHLRPVALFPEFLLYHWQPPPWLPFLFHTSSLPRVWALELWLSVLSLSKWCVPKYLLRAKSMNESKYWEYKHLKRHGPCPQKP